MLTLHFILFIGFAACLHGQAKKDVNYDENKIGTLPIPNPLKCEDGSKISTAEEWTKKRRPELLRLFAREVYGMTPETKLSGLRFVVLSEDKKVLGGKATKRVVAICFCDKKSPRAEIFLYLPNGFHKHAAMVSPRPITTTSNPTTTRASAMVCARSCSSPVRPRRRTTTGERSVPGPGG